jgi:hypothetical protein
MKFLIQKIDGEIKHDFSFTLLESIRYQNWLYQNNNIKVKYINTDSEEKNIEVLMLPFKEFHKHYVPVGSVEFVSSYLKYFYDLTPKPINVPEELFNFTERSIWNANIYGFYKGYNKLFVKSNDNIKGITGIFNEKEYDFPVGNYQFSEVIDIKSEWRAFVYKGNLVGLQNYSGEFTKFPDVNMITEMIKAYKSAPVAYTLDVGVFDEKTFVIEVHDFFSCSNYGMSDHNIYPYMFYRWFHEYLNKFKK